MDKVLQLRAAIASDELRECAFGDESHPLHTGVSVL